MRQILEAFFATEAGLAVYAMLLVAIADFLLGVAAAIRDGVFDLSSVAAWLRKHLAGRVLPATILLVVGHVGNQPALSALGLAAAGLYALETVGSIKDSWGPRDPADGHRLNVAPPD